MKPAMIWANLAVASLERTTQFYTALGFMPNGQPNGQLTSFKFAGNQFIIHFFLKEAIEANMSTAFLAVQSATEVMFSMAAESNAQVDEWAEEVKKAGGKLLSRPEPFGGRYYGFMFADPDGHRFNVFAM